MADKHRLRVRRKFLLLASFTPDFNCPAGAIFSQRSLRKSLEALAVAWPQSVVFGLLDVVVFAEFGPLLKIKITLQDAAYHEVDSSENAFREAGRDAGRNIIETVTRDGLIDFGP